MSGTPPQTVYLKDYRPPDYLVDRVYLDFDLGESETRVTSRLAIRPNPEGTRGAALVLDGEDIVLRSATLDGARLADTDYEIADNRLRIAEVPDRAFELTLETACDPSANTQLSGLYLSGGTFVTQCEAEGFRRITFFPDRPDVLSVFTVRLAAHAERYPLLLANGNLVDQGTLEDGRHWAEWHDPFPKPSYLFALVAGDLGCYRDSFVTRSGRSVDLRIYVDHGLEPQCAYAMDSLKRAMKWDEERFGREYDLDIYMIVAVSDFNMGAMENKGLNIFNSKLILASPDTASDVDYENIEAVVAHEYFHNWSGNRVTCRDWFQLCLKEGLTVFRDQEFSADMRSAAVKRISDVRHLRATQFPEDSGPLAHPVRPSSYIEINNFYTRTVYEKGAELCRMLQTLLGREGFRRGLDLYFERHDGEAATVEQFVAAMADANGRDLGHFMRWYEQAGTPEVIASGTYHARRQSYTLSLSQVVRPTPGQPHKEPLPIPVVVGLLGKKGEALSFTPPEGNGPCEEATLEFKDREAQFEFSGVAEAPTPSLLRGLSAPVRLVSNQSEPQWLLQMVHDPDLYSRWEAGQRYQTALLLSIADALRSGQKARKGERLANAFAALVKDPSLEAAFVAEVLTLPDISDLAQALDGAIDFTALHGARCHLMETIGQQTADVMEHAYQSLTSNAPYEPDAASAGRRALRNTVLRYLTAPRVPASAGRALQHFTAADNMTDVMAALAILTHMEAPERGDALGQFEEKWRDNTLVMEKWLAVQAASTREGVLGDIERLMGHPAFNLRRPNAVRALIGTFALGNPLRFHADDGSGYEFLADKVIEIDSLNPQVAARLLTAFRLWRRLDAARADKSEAALRRVLAKPGLSQDSYEITQKMLVD